MNTLFLIPARGGSKGIPRKNVKQLNGKPLIIYSVETARQLADDADICVSTDSEEVISVVTSVGLNVPFIRPIELSTDTAGSREVINHALSYFESRGRGYDQVILLQPTSPFRSASDVTRMLNLLTHSIDMVVSVRESHDSPYYNAFEEDRNGYLVAVKPSNFERRQDIPKTYAYNGSIYAIQSNSIKSKPFAAFDKVIKYEMDAVHSIDIDTPFDWMIAEMIAEKKLWI